MYVYDELSEKLSVFSLNHGHDFWWTFLHWRHNSKTETESEGLKHLPEANMSWQEAVWQTQETELHSSNVPETLLCLICFFLWGRFEVGGSRMEKDASLISRLHSGCTNIEMKICGHLFTFQALSNLFQPHYHSPYDANYCLIVAFCFQRLSKLLEPFFLVSQVCEKLINLDKIPWCKLIVSLSGKCSHFSNSNPPVWNMDSPSKMCSIWAKAEITWRHHQSVSSDIHRATDKMIQLFPCWVSMTTDLSYTYTIVV